MKNLLLILALFFMSAYSYCQHKNDLKTYNLKGNIKSVTFSNYMAIEKFGEVQKGSLKNRLFLKFNKKGNLESLSEDVKYFYDFKGRLVKIESFVKSMMGPHFDTYLYDEKGNNIEINRFKFDGEIITKHKMKYNNNNFKIEQNEYNSIGNLQNKRIYKCDLKGNNVIENVYSSNGDLEWKVNYKYDEKGNCIEEEEWMSTVLNKRVLTQYDLKNNEISFDCTFADVSLKKYNSHCKFENKYDNKGNRISQLTFEEGKATEIAIREIEYYPISKK